MQETLPGTPPAEPSANRLPASDSVKLQILATEHWSLLATRSMVWNEMFTRAGMFLSTLSAAMVALALVAQATDFGATFRALALLVLPVVLFIGIATDIRLGHAARVEVWSVIGMNRLRHAYLEIAPELEPHFVTSQYDDLAGFMHTAGHWERAGLGQVVASTPALVGVLCSVLAGVIAALVVATATDWFVLHVVAGVVVGLAVAVVMLLVLPSRQFARELAKYQPRFPRTPAGADGDA